MSVTADIERRYGPVVATVNSRSAPDQCYQVRNKNNILSCNCKGFIFSRDRPKRCRHTDVVARNLSAESQSKDRAVVICEELLDVIGHNVPLGTLQRMAGCLRPYLSVNVQRTTATVQRSNNLLVSTKRLITLEDD